MIETETTTNRRHDTNLIRNRSWNPNRQSNQSCWWRCWATSAPPGASTIAVGTRKRNTIFQPNFSAILHWSSQKTPKRKREKNTTTTNAFQIERNCRERERESTSCCCCCWLFLELSFFITRLQKKITRDSGGNRVWNQSINQ